MAKTLCDWSKHDLEKHPEHLAELVHDPRFYCRKCARVANTPKVLCKARSLPPPAVAHAPGGAENPDARD